MHPTHQKIPGIAGIVIAAVVSLLIGIAGVLVIIIRNARKPERGRDTRDAAVRMEEFYGEPFAVTSSILAANDEKIAFRTLTDSSGEHPPETGDNQANAYFYDQGE